MPIIRSDTFVLTDSTPEFPVTADHPVIGMHNLVTATSIVASDEDPLWPASNLGNPSTWLEWRGESDGTVYLTVTTDYVDEIDYIAVAKHNWGSEQIPVTIEGYIDGDWEELLGERLLANDSPVMFRFTAQSLSQIRIKLEVADEDHLPRAAVVYCGKLLTLPRKIYVEHTPLPYGRKTEIQNGRSESGNFLGRVMIGAWRESVIPLSLMPPAWHRQYGDAFIEQAATLPFFFAWRPETYPDEVGFCWLTEDPMPKPVSPANLDAYDLKVSGVV
jgi:hypothetical protein